MTADPATAPATPAARRGHLVVRVLRLLAAQALLVLACSGWLADTAMTQTSPIKYAATVAGALMLASMAVAKRPYLPVTLLLVVAAPFATFEASAGGNTFRLVVLLLALSCIVFWLGAGRRLGRSATSRIAPWAAVLLVVPVVIGEHRAAFLSVLVGGILVTWVVGRAVAADGPDKVAGALVLMAVVQGLLAVYQYRSGTAFNLYAGNQTARDSSYFFGYDGVFRSTGAFADPISMGNVFAYVLPLALVLIVQQVRRVRLWVAVPLLLAVPVIVGGLVTSLSRMSWIAAGVGVLVTVALLPGRARTVVASCLAACAVLGLHFATVLAGPALAPRIQSILHPMGTGVETASGDEMRLTLWGFAWRTWSEHPITGIGMGEFPWASMETMLNQSQYTHAHNVFLHLAAEGGLLAVSALLLVLTAMSRDLLTLFRLRRFEAAGLIGAFAAFLFAGLTDTTFLMQQNVMIVVASILGLLLGMLVHGTASPADEPVTVDLREPAPEREPLVVRGA